MPQEPLIKPLGELLTKDNLMSVTPWKDFAVRCYLQLDSSRQCEVVEIRRYKKNKPPQHEYLVAVLQCQNGEKRYIRIERGSQNVDMSTGVPVLSEKQTSWIRNYASSASPKSEGVFPPDISSGSWTSWIKSVDGDIPEDPQPPPRSDHNFTSTSAFISASISKTGQAHDIASYWEPSYLHARQEKQIESFKLKTPIPLAYLAILAYVVHEEEALYNLFKYQCYWYAEMIAAVIHKQDQGNIAMPKSHNTAPQPCDHVQRCFDPTSGKFKAISILKIRPLVVEKIEQKYLAECERLTATLESASPERRIRDLEEQVERLKRQSPQNEANYPPQRIL
ncbi:hypothetical protein HYPSUDRAFT_34461 [Hypholoma sublateritium FD-334 SS-4]|uniref:Uncharacterized protein n=1 Tax=Hypholoma sublateritium (strain FD-334 SS-4) TaxID=945553 RepID=A0A0D2Q8W1_HYPSF|nr:hypothetical protein HYPSUDRAFT_34461 [Hypholoma sublateritium FD-334 SS-4]